MEITDLNPIQDLILPKVYFDKVEKIEELNKKYEVEFRTDGLMLHSPRIKLNNIHDYIKELDEIENYKPKYCSKFWRKVKLLNKQYLEKLNIKLLITSDYIYFWFDYDSNICFKHNELDLINDQYRLLQEIYYTRLHNKEN